MNKQLRKLLTISSATLMLVSLGTGAINSSVQAKRTHRITRHYQKHQHPRIPKRPNSHYMYVDKDGLPYATTKSGVDFYLKTNTLVHVLGNIKYNGIKYYYVKAGKKKGYIHSAALATKPNAPSRKHKCNDIDYMVKCASLETKLQDEHEKQGNNKAAGSISKYKGTKLYKLGYKQAKYAYPILTNIRLTDIMASFGKNEEYDPKLKLKGQKLIQKYLTTNRHAFNKAYDAGFIKGCLDSSPELHDTDVSGVEGETPLEVDDKGAANGDIAQVRSYAQALIKTFQHYMTHKSKRYRHKLLYESENGIYDICFMPSLKAARADILRDLQLDSYTAKTDKQTRHKLEKFNAWP